MNLERCFEIFEINSKTSMEEVKRVYRDLVTIWHPDRFSHNPRLKEIAEKKLKEVNMAYRLLNNPENFSESKLKPRQLNEKRMHFRRYCSIMTEYIIQNRPFYTFQDPIENISGGGIFIETKSSFTKGQKLSLSFTLPLFGELTNMFGEIIRCTSQGIGVKFNISNRYKKLISDLI